MLFQIYLPKVFFKYKSFAILFTWRRYAFSQGPIEHWCMVVYFCQLPPENSSESAVKNRDKLYHQQSHSPIAQDLRISFNYHYWYAQQCLNTDISNTYTVLCCNENFLKQYYILNFIMDHKQKVCFKDECFQIF